MKRILLVGLLSTIFVGVSGNYAISHGIGKTKEVVALACEGKSVYQYIASRKDSNVQRERFNEYDNTASILITTEYYPWEDKKTHNVNFENSGTKFQLSSDTKSVGWTDQPNFNVTLHRINNLSIWIRNATRQIVNNDKWTKDESQKFWSLHSQQITFDFNVVSLEVSTKVEDNNLTMDDSRDTYREFRGKCSAVKTPFKI